ncbi:G2/mitotic-specific cyclin S13-6 [Linum perenne]
MASRPIVPQQARDGLNKNPPDQQQLKKGGGAGNKNRKALGDIGNLGADVPEIAGKKIARPVTRSFRAQLLANAQTAADKKQICVKVTRAPAVVKNAPAAALKKPAPAAAAAAVVVKPKPKPAEVINVQSDTEKEEATKTNNDKKKIREESKKKKKKVQTFTSILATGSKLAKNKPNQPESVFNIDAADAGNHLAVTDYVDDIYTFYKEAEVNNIENRPKLYIETQPEITIRMRSILADWLIDVHQKFDLALETLYLTIDIVDRFLSAKPVPRRELQLVGIAATLTASKYEEIWPPEVNDLVAISDMAYTNTQILTMEKTILAHLEWTLTVPTRFVFLTRFVKAAGDRESLGHMAAFFSELGLMDYECSVGYKPSVVAAAAVYAARRVMKRVPVWSPVLEFYSGYREDEVVGCAKILIGLKEVVKEGKLGAVMKKYSSPLKGSVALISSPAVKN